MTLQSTAAQRMSILIVRALIDCADVAIICLASTLWLNGRDTDSGGAGSLVNAWPCHLLVALWLRWLAMARSD